MKILRNADDVFRLYSYRIKPSFPEVIDQSTPGLRNLEKAL